MNCMATSYTVWLLVSYLALLKLNEAYLEDIGLVLPVQGEIELWELSWIWSLYKYRNES